MDWINELTALKEFNESNKQLFLIVDNHFKDSHNHDKQCDTSIRTQYFISKTWHEKLVEISTSRTSTFSKTMSTSLFGAPSNTIKSIDAASLTPQKATETNASKTQENTKTKTLSDCGDSKEFANSIRFGEKRKTTESTDNEPTSASKVHRDFAVASGSFDWTSSVSKTSASNSSKSPQKSRKRTLR